MENPIFAVTQLAQTTMRSELGKLTLDNTFLERNALNKAIVEVGANCDAYSREAKVLHFKFSGHLS